MSEELDRHRRLVDGVVGKPDLVAVRGTGSTVGSGGRRVHHLFCKSTTLEWIVVYGRFYRITFGSAPVTLSISDVGLEVLGILVDVYTEWVGRPVDARITEEVGATLLITQMFVDCQIDRNMLNKGGEVTVSCRKYSHFPFFFLFLSSFWKHLDGEWRFWGEMIRFEKICLRHLFGFEKKVERQLLMSQGGLICRFDRFGQRLQNF